MKAGHSHRCPLCRKQLMCDHDCETDRDRPHIGDPLHCAECSVALDEIADLPTPVRPAMTLAELVRAVDAGVKAALDAVQRNPERCVAILESHLRPLLPADPTRQDLDTWARLGAVEGARAAWVGRQPLGPKDCVDRLAAQAFVLACSNASMLVVLNRKDRS